MEQLIQGHYKIVISTGQYFGEGIDLNNLECLVIAYPFAFEGKLIQYIGRIQHSDNPPVIFDYRDSKIDYFEKMFKQRNRYYKKLSKKVQIDWVFGTIKVLKYFVKIIQCWETSWNITGGQTGQRKSRSLIATQPKISFSSKKKLQPSPWKSLYISSFELVRVSEWNKKKQEVDFDLLCLWVPGAGLEPAQP